MLFFSCGDNTRLIESASDAYAFLIAFVNPGHYYTLTYQDIAEGQIVTWIPMSV